MSAYATNLHVSLVPADSWHESRPGILHAYDADNIETELWNSLQKPERDDCGEYSKMAPPTIANGKVYLSSFGTENVGTGQFCVYGLLPNGPAPAKPEGVKAVLANKEINLSWPAVPGAITYAVQSTNSGATTKLASGLTSPSLAHVPAELGKSAFTVVASNSNGESVASDPVSVAVQTRLPRTDQWSCPDHHCRQLDKEHICSTVVHWDARQISIRRSKIDMTAIAF